jgi:hypothetical protein
MDMHVVQPKPLKNIANDFVHLDAYADANPRTRCNPSAALSLSYFFPQRRLASQSPLATDSHSISSSVSCHHDFIFAPPLYPSAYQLRPSGLIVVDYLRQKQPKQNPRNTEDFASSRTA